MKTLNGTLILIGMAGSAWAGEIISAYTDLNVEKCQKTATAAEGEGEWSEWRCKGLKGVDVRVSEDDLRFTVSLGPNAENQCSAHQTFNKFNYLGPRIEWRLENDKPFATILRWYQSADGEKTNWLVVSKYDGRQSCHVAYVEPTTPNANVMARQVADERARSFDCDKDKPEVISASAMDLSDLVSGISCQAN